MITTMRIFFFVGLIELSKKYPEGGFFLHYLILSALVGALVAIAQTIV
jgi:hypothetical protein